jgi:hypothetical protein
MIKKEKVEPAGIVIVPTFLSKVKAVAIERVEACAKSIKIGIEQHQMGRI